MKLRLVLALSVLLTGCVSTDERMIDSLKFTEWKLVSLDQRDVTEAGAEIAFIEALQIRGYTGCNRFFASGKVEKGRLLASDTGMTRRFCQGLEGEVETALLAALEQGAKSRQDRDTLTLSGAHTLVFKRIIQP